MADGLSRASSPITPRVELGRFLPRLFSPLLVGRSDFPLQKAVLALDLRCLALMRRVRRHRAVSASSHRRVCPQLSGGLRPHAGPNNISVGWTAGLAELSPASGDRQCALDAGCECLDRRMASGGLPRCADGPASLSVSRCSRSDCGSLSAVSWIWCCGVCYSLDSGGELVSHSARKCRRHPALPGTSSER